MPDGHTESRSRARAEDSPPQIERIFYDGHCGLCHGAVRFVIARDPQGRLFRYAPLEGTTFAALVPAKRRADLPDSVIVLTEDGRLLVRSAAFIHILRRLGGVWRVTAAIIASDSPRDSRWRLRFYCARALPDFWAAAGSVPGDAGRIARPLRRLIARFSRGLPSTENSKELAGTPFVKPRGKPAVQRRRRSLRN